MNGGGTKLGRGNGTGRVVTRGRFFCCFPWVGSCAFLCSSWHFRRGGVSSWAADEYRAGLSGALPRGGWWVRKGCGVARFWWKMTAFWMSLCEDSSPDIRLFSWIEWV